MTDYQKNHPDTIQAMFGSIAKNYDRTNAALSFGLHKRWNKFLVNLAAKTSPCTKVLDLCCGTGEIALGFLKNDNAAHEIFLLDFCKEMLECAKLKAATLDQHRHKLHFLQADAQAIPLPNGSIDCATVAYGIRNVKDPNKCAKEVFRVLRKGGSFSILELTRPENPLMQIGHSAYLKTVVPVLGKLLTSNKDAYNYLQNSIITFIPPSHLEKILRDNDFQQISRHTLTCGIATIISGIKP